MRLPVRKRRQMRVVEWLNARLTVIFVLILVVFLLGSGASVYAFNIQRSLDEQKVLLREDADGILQAMVDQQTSLRDYISNNNPQLLTPFHQGRATYVASVQDLIARLQSSAFRHTLVGLTVMQETADDWYSTYATIQINQMQSGNLAGPRSDTSIAQGNDLFDRFRASIAHLQETIAQDLAGYQDQVDIINFGLLCGGLALAIVANFAFLLLLRSFTKRLQTQIVSLTSTTERLGQGEKEARVASLTFTDLDQVGQSLNRMAEAIIQHERRLEESMHSLAHQYVLVERARSESRAIFDASSEAFLFVSADGEVSALNRPFREFFAMSAEEIIGMPFAELQPRWEALFVNADAFHTDLAQDSANQERRYTTTMTQREPQYRELAVTSTPVPGSNNAYLGRLYVLRDITREREAERLKAEFQSLISHGLRSPLTSIKGYLDLLAQQEESGPLNDLQREFLEIVRGNTQRLLGLVNDLLDISRLEAQSLMISPVPLDLHPLIRDVSRTLGLQIEERHQRLSLRLASEPLRVLGDENRVGQILTNLLTFASSNTPVGGRIVWHTRQEKSMARIICFSSGELTAVDLAAFTRSFLHDTPNSRPGPLGGVLGPSITRSLVELHGGTLQVSAGPDGGGYALAFTLPLASSEMPTPQAAARLA